jgi:hypothetical protein
LIEYIWLNFLTLGEESILFLIKGIKISSKEYFNLALRIFYLSQKCQGRFLWQWKSVWSMKLLIFSNLSPYQLYSFMFYWQIMLCSWYSLLNFHYIAECDMMIYDRNVRGYFKNNFCLIIYQLTAFITNHEILAGIWSKGWYVIANI